MTTENQTTKSPSHEAFQVRNREGSKGFWTRIGSAWTNKDGSYSIYLDAIPLDGRIVLRVPAEKAKA